MAKLYFYYSAMNAGKTTVLLQSSYNYQERGMATLLFSAEIDGRSGIGKIASRIGLQANAITFGPTFNFWEHVTAAQLAEPNLRCILVDEAQFLTKSQVQQLAMIVDQLAIPVLAYGLRSDFQGEPFEGSLYLLVWADNLVEIKTVCTCGRKATMNARIGEDGKIQRTGAQVQIGGNESYTSMCRKHFHGQ